MLPELQALCRSPGLPAGGSSADLAARLAAALPGRGLAEEKIVVVVVAAKGCLKRSGCGSSGGEGSDPGKNVTFVREGDAEAEAEVVAVEKPEDVERSRSKMRRQRKKNGQIRGGVRSGLRSFNSSGSSAFFNANNTRLLVIVTVTIG